MKLHVSMNVENLDGAIDFYTRLFATEPVVRRPGYAKWDVADPPVNFVIEDGKAERGLDHLGIEVDNDTELAELAGRVRDSGQPFLDIEKTTCCFARSDKAWVRGVANEKWETFLTHSHDEPEYGSDRESQLDPV